MGDAYTPGLTVTRRTRVAKTRRLPMSGTVLRKVGDRVRSTDVVARTELPGKVHLLNLATALGALPDELADKLVVKPGGAFYAFPRVPEHLGLSDEQFITRALERNVLVIPGSVFSRRGTHFRLSYAASQRSLDGGLAVLAELMS